MRPGTRCRPIQPGRISFHLPRHPTQRPPRRHRGSVMEAPFLNHDGITQFAITCPALPSEYMAKSARTFFVHDSGPEFKPTEPAVASFSGNFDRDVSVSNFLRETSVGVAGCRESTPTLNSVRKLCGLQAYPQNPQERWCA